MLTVLAIEFGLDFAIRLSLQVSELELGCKSYKRSNGRFLFSGNDYVGYSKNDANFEHIVQSDLTNLCLVSILKYQAFRIHVQL